MPLILGFPVIGSSSRHHSYSTSVQTGLVSSARVHCAALGKRGPLNASTGHRSPVSALVHKCTTQNTNTHACACCTQVLVAESTKIQHFDPRVLKLSSPKPTPPHFFLIFSKFCKFFCVFNFMNFFCFKFLPLFFIVFQKKFHFFVLTEFLTFFWSPNTTPLCFTELQTTMNLRRTG